MRLRIIATWETYVGRLQHPDTLKLEVELEATQEAEKVKGQRSKVHQSMDWFKGQSTETIGFDMF